MAEIKAEKMATRQAYGKTLVELGKTTPNLVVMDADLSKSTMTADFAKAYPDRFFNMGIAEQNLYAAACGLALSGKVVCASTFAMFAAGRNYEQVRNSIGYPHLNVKIGATHAGISVGEDGATHQCCEDIALMRTIPGMTILNPADDVEARAAVEAAVKYQGPVYLRFGRLAAPIFNDPATYHFEMGKGITLRQGKDVTIVATGLMVSEALEAAATLANEGIDAGVINIHTIKPLDTELICKAAQQTGLLVTVEEHSIIGGLGSAVAEAVTGCCPVPVARIGVNDEFGHSGPAADLLKQFGLSAEHIVEVAKDFCGK